MIWCSFAQVLFLRLRLRGRFVGSAVGEWSVQWISRCLSLMRCMRTYGADTPRLIALVKREENTRVRGKLPPPFPLVAGPASQEGLFSVFLFRAAQWHIL